MIIKEIAIKNFRCFRDMQVDFDDRLAVLVGKKGTGISAMLDAVPVVFSAIKKSLVEYSRSFLGIPNARREMHDHHPRRHPYHRAVRRPNRHFFQ